MKKLFFFLLTTIILGAFNGCSKPINPPEPPPVVVKVKQFTITATVIGSNGTISPTSAVVDSGKSIILTITPRDGYVVDTFKVNGVPVSLTSLTYVIYNVSSKQNIEVTFKYKYDIGTTEWYLTQFVWVAIANWAKVGDTWYDFTDDSLKDIFTYNPDGTYDELWNGSNYHGSWSFNPATKILTVEGKYPVKVDFIDDKKMVVIFTNNMGIIYMITSTNDGVIRFK